jgi:pilus assembly protein CpaC
MYVEINPRKFPAIQPLTATTLVSMAILCCLGSPVLAQPQVVRNITQASERLELTVNTSRILTLDKRIPRMVVNNPELVTVTPISANQVQVAARKPGVTQVNLWDEDDKVYTVDVVIYGDVRELELALQRIFPDSSVKVVRLTNSLVLEGFVERPESVGPILRLAEDYAPKIVNNITVGGVQQVLLKVKVMEVSRTKLRNLGFDFAVGSAGGGGFVSSISGMIQSFSPDAIPASVTGTPGTAAFRITNGNNEFWGFLQALQENKLGKIIADPTITTVSGRPARFNVGGQIPVPVPQGGGAGGATTITIQWKDYGTTIDFLPIVLGNGNIRLEVRPEVSDLDYTNAIGLPGLPAGSKPVPAMKTRRVDTGVELKAGQTLALAGLVQTKVDAFERGIPYVSDVPYLGALFRKVQEEVNEVELLILVTPEFVDGMEPHEVPPCGPGMETVSPNNCQLYFGGLLEVPACGPCAPNGCAMNCANSYNMTQPGGYALTSDAGMNYGPTPVETQPVPATIQQGATEEYLPAYSDIPAPQEYQPAPQEYQQSVPQGYSAPPAPPAEAGSPAQEEPADDSSAVQFPSPWQQSRPVTEYSRPAPQTPVLTQPARTATSTPGLIGPIGYDMEK